jgi:hypothetical protein
MQCKYVEIWVQRSWNVKLVDSVSLKARYYLCIRRMFRLYDPLHWAADSALYRSDVREPDLSVAKDKIISLDLQGNIDFIYAPRASSSTTVLALEAGATRTVICGR